MAFFLGRPILIERLSCIRCKAKRLSSVNLILNIHFGRIAMVRKRHDLRSYFYRGPIYTLIHIVVMQLRLIWAAFKVD
jgi:hypothetical protein